MKAAVIDRFGGPEEIYYTDIEKPVPGPDEVLVKNVYIGVGKPDYIMRSGICPFLEQSRRSWLWAMNVPVLWRQWVQM